jgi:glycosyltransferase involved in cell wall biosynthesis
MDERYTYLVATRCFTYNHAPYIDDTLQGFAIQQTSFPVVSVIIDDASPDGEQDILRSWAKQNLALDEEGFAYDRAMDYGELFFARHKDKVDCFLGAAATLVRQSIGEYLKDGRDHLEVAFGCTGGQHRSVYFAERMAERLAGIDGMEVEVNHAARLFWELKEKP